MNAWLGMIGIGIALGVVTEALARLLRLWVYQDWLTPVLNVLLMFGLAFGTLSWILVGHPVLAAFAGAGVGIAYEYANHVVLRLWHFPNDRLLFLHGAPALVIGVGLAWGAIPPVIIHLADRLERAL